jgi:hypothetical protein
VFLRGLAVMLQWAHHSILSDGSETTQCATGTEVPVLSPSTECWRFPSTRWEGRLGLVMGNGLRLGDSPVQMSRVADSRKGPPL